MSIDRLRLFFILKFNASTYLSSQFVMNDKKFYFIGIIFYFFAFDEQKTKMDDIPKLSFILMSTSTLLIVLWFLCEHFDCVVVFFFAQSNFIYFLTSLQQTNCTKIQKMRRKLTSNKPILWTFSGVIPNSCKTLQGNSWRF